jgi:hypothetical protein
MTTRAEAANQWAAALGPCPQPVSGRSAPTAEAASAGAHEGITRANELSLQRSLVLFAGKPSMDVTASVAPTDGLLVSIRLTPLFSILTSPPAAAVELIWRPVSPGCLRHPYTLWLGHLPIGHCAGA